MIPLDSFDADQFKLVSLVNPSFMDERSMEKDLLEHFWSVIVVSNPARYKSRYKLYNRIAGEFKTAGAKVITVEIAFGERPFEITERDNPYHLQVRTVDELWHKENMLNLGIEHVLQLDPDALYFATIDADIMPMRPIREWLEETFHELQHHHVVQMFETAYDLNPADSIMGKAQVSFMSQYIKTGCVLPEKGGFWNDDFYSIHGHPGFCWAYTRYALDSLGGLIDFAILGAGDRHMCLGLVGCMDQSFENKTSGYVQQLLQWQTRSERWIKRDVGFVKGSIYHYWHGSKRTRFYSDRWKILRDNLFDPRTDLKRDAQGLLILETWNQRQIKLRDQLRAYTKSRNEDSIDV